MASNRPPEQPTTKTFERQVEDIARRVLNDNKGAAILFVGRDEHGNPRLGVRRSQFINEVVGIGGVLSGHGSLTDQLDEKLSQLVHAVNEFEGNGKIVLTLSMKHDKANVVDVSAQVKATIPQPPMGNRKRYADNGRLVNADPNQAKLPFASSSTGEMVVSLTRPVADDMAN